MKITPELIPRFFFSLLHILLFFCYLMNIQLYLILFIQNIIHLPIVLVYYHVSSVLYLFHRSEIFHRADTTTLCFNYLLLINLMSKEELFKKKMEKIQVFDSLITQIQEDYSEGMTSFAYTKFLNENVGNCLNITHFNKFGPAHLVLEEKEQKNQFKLKKLDKSELTNPFTIEDPEEREEQDRLIKEYYNKPELNSISDFGIVNAPAHLIHS